MVRGYNKLRFYFFKIPDVLPFNQTLQYLNLVDNQIKYLNLDYFSKANFPVLANLNLSRNHLISYPEYIIKATQKSRLESIDLSYNRLTYIDIGVFESMSWLFYLYLDHNFNDGFNITGQCSLKLQISIDGTISTGLLNLTSILEHLPHLSAISAWYSGITEIETDSHQSFENKHLNKIDFTGNDFSNRHCFDLSIFHGFKNLNGIILDVCNISWLCGDPNRKVNLERAFVKENHLFEIDFEFLVQVTPLISIFRANSNNIVQVIM